MRSRSITVSIDIDLSQLCITTLAYSSCMGGVTIGWRVNDVHIWHWPWWQAYIYLDAYLCKIYDSIYLSVQLSVCHSHRVLKVVMDNNLTGHDHVNSLSKNRSRKVHHLYRIDRLVGLVVNASAPMGRSGVRIPRAAGLLRVESYQWLKKMVFQFPVATLRGARRYRVSTGTWCQYTVNGWGRKFDLQFLSQCGRT